MKHALFPSVAAADAFIDDLQQQGVATLDSSTVNVNRRDGAAILTEGYTGTVAEEAGEGAVKGTGVGVVVGAAAGALTTAGVLGTVAATVATGGLALPVILGMAAAGAGIGAAVGAAGGAAGAESDASGGTAARYSSNYAVDDAHYDQMNQGVAAGGRAVAIEESVPQGALDAALQRHGGHLI